MICVYNESSVQAGRQAYHSDFGSPHQPSDDPHDRQRSCPNGDHWRIQATLAAARRYERQAADGAGGAYYRRIAKTIRDAL